MIQVAKAMECEEQSPQHDKQQRDENEPDPDRETGGLTDAPGCR